MTSSKRPFVAKEDRRVIFPAQVPIPPDALFPHLELRLMDEMARVANLRNKTQEKILAARRTLIHMILEALFIAVKVSSEQACVALPTSNQSHSRKNGTGIGSHRTVLQLIEAMTTLSWISVTRGGRTRELENLVTTITPVGELLELLQNQPLIWRPLPIPTECLIVRVKDPKTKQKYKVPFTSNNHTRNLQKRVRLINQFYSQHAIALNLEQHEMDTLALRLSGYKSIKAYLDAKFVGDNPVAHTPPQNINLLAIHLRRIYSRDSLYKGGRHYGPWWQAIPKEFRSSITIDGQPTVELDFSEFHPRMMYAIAGVAPPEGDLYDIWLSTDPIIPDMTNPEYKQIRKLIKKLINAWINDESGYFNLSPEEYEQIGMSRSKVVYRIRKKHPILDKYKGCGWGLDFQHMDAEIAENVIFKLMQQGIVCISIYDSFRVPVDHERALRQAMNGSYQEFFDETPEIAEPELPAAEVEMPVYPLVHVDEHGNEYQYTDWDYQKNHRQSSPYHLYLSSFWDGKPSKEARTSLTIR